MCAMSITKKIDFGFKNIKFNKSELNAVLIISIAHFAFHINDDNTITIQIGVKYTNLLSLYLVCSHNEIAVTHSNRWNKTNYAFKWNI